MRKKNGFGVSGSIRPHPQPRFLVVALFMAYHSYITMAPRQQSALLESMYSGQEVPPTTKLVASFFIFFDNVKDYRFTSRYSPRVRRGSADSLHIHGFPPVRVISGVCDIFLFLIKKIAMGGGGLGNECEHAKVFPHLLTWATKQTSQNFLFLFVSQGRGRRKRIVNMISTNRILRVWLKAHGPLRFLTCFGYHHLYHCLGKPRCHT